MPGFRDSVDIDLGPAGRRVDVAFTDATLDLQDGAAGTVARTQLEADLGVAVVRAHQVHGTEVHVVERPAQPDPVPVADALITAVPGAALMIRVADCVPVLLADTRGAVVGAVHAGRRGVELDVTTRAVDQMRSLGATDLRGWVGPHICGRCYEVPDAMRDEVATRAPATWAETSWGTPALDLGAGVAAQLEAAGVSATVVPGCTREDRALHSYRRDGAAAGRNAGLVWLSGGTP